MLYVVGDSHCRSFSYHPECLPLFVAPGKRLLLNSGDQLNETIELLNKTVCGIPESSKLMLLVGEPSLRSFLESGGGSNSLYAKKFIESIFKLQENLSKYKLELHIVPPVPREDEKYAALWVLVRDEMVRQKLPCATVFDEAVSGDGIIKQEYIGDFIHANQLLADLTLSKLLDSNMASSNRFAWSYEYSLPSKAKIWGGVPMESLVYDGVKSRNWSEMRLKTTSMELFCQFLNRVSVLFSKFGNEAPLFNICTDDEGYIQLGSCIHSVSIGEDWTSRDLLKTRYACLSAMLAKFNGDAVITSNPLLSSEVELKCLVVSRSFIPNLACAIESTNSSIVFVIDHCATKEIERSINAVGFSVDLRFQFASLGVVCLYSKDWSNLTRVKCFSIIQSAFSTVFMLRILAQIKQASKNVKLKLIDFFSSLPNKDVA
ncbi:hypothetical protein NBRC116494_25330 [Aurantivibrio plasticivorans]